MSSKTSNRRSKGWLLILAILLALCALAAMGGFLFYRPVKESVIVMVNEPQNAALVSALETVPNAATGYYTDGVNRLELYVDGGLTAVQETSLPDGSNPLMLIHEWTPLTPGCHLISVRAYARDGQIADSQVVMVDVLAAPQTLDIDLNSLRDPASGACPSLASVRRREAHRHL